MNNKKITLSHGAGGAITQRLVQELFHKYFHNPVLETQLDSALLSLKAGKWALTTDSFIVKPLFFPGGNIGKLSVCGTVNDLAVMGAVPLYLTCSFIIEEGFGIDQLEVIVESMSKTAREDGIIIAAGDTKVVEKGSGDGVFITTTGLGLVANGVNYTPQAIRDNDRVIITGPAGAHGLAVLAARGELGVEPPPQSDCASLYQLISPLNVLEVRCMRDPTRGGLAAALNELAMQSRKGIRIDESLIPVDSKTTNLMDLLGVDPFQLANEGSAIIIISEKDAERALEIVKTHPLGRSASVIGEITAENPGQVIMITRLGTERIVPMPSGVIIPRIC